MRCGNCKNEHPAVADVRACYAGQTPTPPRANEVPDGTYTVVFDGRDDRITVRLRHEDWADGKQVAAFLSGPDNERSYTGFGFVVDARLRTWKRYRGDGRPAAAVKFLLEAGAERVAEAGLAYALASDNCYRCNRKLTVPASIHRGLGPVCAGVIGATEVEEVSASSAAESEQFNREWAELKNEAARREDAQERAAFAQEVLL